MELCLTVLLCNVLLIFYAQQAFTKPTAVLFPSGGYNAGLGSTATFTCIINGSTSVLWLVDGTSENENKGITINPILSQSDGTSLSQLNVPATIQNDGVEVYCLAVTTLVNGPSETVTLSIQGLLSSPSALEINTQNGHSQLLTWTPPPTLDLTNVDPDISFYNVCSTILNEVSCIEVQNTEHSFTNTRIRIEFSVSAVNVVGEGNASTITHEPCDPTTGN